MAKAKVVETQLNMLAQLELDALIEGMRGEQKNNPQFLAKVRSFLKDNNILVLPTDEQTQEIINTVVDNNIPVFAGECEMH